jgi:hypothetical protein
MSGLSSTLAIDGEELAARLNADGEFLLASRFWTGSVGLRISEAQWVVELRAGRVQAVRRADSEAVTIMVAGPASEWAELLAHVPRPFYQDLWGATFRHDLQLVGDDDLVAAYYGATRRLIDILRAMQEPSFAPGS